MRPGRGEIERLLARGGWELDDVQARHRENPDTFWLPSAEQLAALRPGDSARLIFRLVDQADRVRDEIPPYDDDGRPNLVDWHERMWLHIEERDGDRFVGILQNHPYSSHTALEAGCRVEFGARDIIDVDARGDGGMQEDLDAMAEAGFGLQPVEAARRPVDPLRPREIGAAQQAVCDRHGVRSERPLPFSAALVSSSLEDGTAWPIYGARFSPRPDRNDCGWAVWAAEPSMEVVAETDGMHPVHFGHLRTMRPEAWPYLALPPGWAFMLAEDGTEDVYFDPGDLL